MTLFRIWKLVCATVVALNLVSPLRAATFVIPDGDVAALKSAINTANNNTYENDTIELAPNGTYILSTAESSGLGSIGLPAIFDYENSTLGQKKVTVLTINGNGATIARSNAPGTPEFRILLVLISSKWATVSISGLTVSNGLTSDARGGAGILFLGSGTLTMKDSTIRDNTAEARGGGIRSGGGLNLVNCTVSENTSGVEGGGLYGHGELTAISNCTISDNTATAAGAGLIAYNSDGRMFIQNSTITRNTASTGRGSGIRHVSGSALLNISNSLIAGNTNSDVDTDFNSLNRISSSGYNLIGITNAPNKFRASGDRTGVTAAQLKLGPLADNGGSTKTYALLRGSQAINAGDPDFVPLLNTDQRGSGFARVQGGRLDIGAFESRFVSISINNPRTVEEGDSGSPGFAEFDVVLSAPATQTITVNYKTTDNTAQAGIDYVAKSGKLTFAPGETSQLARVDFIGDSVAELAETFFLDLSTPVASTINDSRSGAYIRDDDGPKISIDDARGVNEGNNGNTPQTFTVILSAPSNHPVSVDWATANNSAGPADYVVASGTLTFAPGETQKTIVVQIKGDALVEPSETYKVNLSRPTYAVLSDSQGIGFIKNDDQTSALAADEPSS